MRARVDGSDGRSLPRIHGPYGWVSDYVGDKGPASSVSR